MKQLQSRSGRSHDKSGLRFELSCRDLFCSQQGAIHIIGIIIVLISIYSTLLLLGSSQRIEVLEQTVAQQAKRIERLEMKVNILELHRSSTAP
jgi:hypothetical protein